MTGLVLLSYFDRSETPVSEEFGDSCTRGIVYLVNLGLKNQGKLSNHLTANHWSYEHAIATYALGEAATFCRQGKIEIPSLMEVTEASGQFIYGHYDESQAMMQRGGADWKRYNEIFRDQLLDNQDLDGSWKAPGGGKKPRAVAAS